MVSYDSAVAHLYELGHELTRTAGRKFDLELVRVLLGALDHPERCFPSVLIAGTNGKGSTAATLASILQAAGHRTALYTSPHLLRINERMRISGGEISDRDFALAYERVEAAAQALLSAGKLPWHPSFFEMLTAMAFTHFAEPAVDIAVLEVGMGGRLDATNVVEPLVSVITDISLDHEKFLGHTITEIAREKAGIIRAGGMVVTLPQHPEANEVIGTTVLQCGARLVNAVPFVPPLRPGAESLLVPAGVPVSPPVASDRSALTESEPGSPGARQDPVRTGYLLEVMGRQILVDSPLGGQHQWRNIALAIAAAEQLNQAGVRISPHDVCVGVRQTRWPGRFQIIPADPQRERPETVLDVAHNPAGAWALRAALSERYLSSETASDNRALTYMFGAMRDKAISEIAAILFPLAQHVIVTRANTPRSADPEEIRALADRISSNIECESTVAAAMEHAHALAGADGVVVITGSIYVVGEALAALQLRH
jgi:dihydrofolate synthase/folylpolyglutamate synthase